jgi:hypothetical protein
MTSQSPSISIDSTKERDNVLVVLDAIVLVATVPPSEAYRVSASDFGRDFPHPHWVIPIDQIQRVDGGESNLRVKFTSDNGQDKSVQFLTTAEKVSIAWRLSNAADRVFGQCSSAGRRISEGGLFAAAWPRQWPA